LRHGIDLNFRAGRVGSLPTQLNIILVCYELLVKQLIYLLLLLTLLSIDRRSVTLDCFGCRLVKPCCRLISRVIFRLRLNSIVCLPQYLDLLAFNLFQFLLVILLDCEIKHSKNGPMIRKLYLSPIIVQQCAVVFFVKYTISIRRYAHLFTSIIHIRVHVVFKSGLEV